MGPTQSTPDSCPSSTYLTMEKVWKVPHLPRAVRSTFSQARNVPDADYLIRGHRCSSGWKERRHVVLMVCQDSDPVRDVLFNIRRVLSSEADVWKSRKSF